MRIEAGKYYKTRDGRKVGPMVISDSGPTFSPIYYARGRTGFWGRDGSFENEYTGVAMLDIVSEWSEGPIRTVTRREIVGGTYGCVEVDVHSFGMNVVVDFSGGKCTPEELREAAHILNQIAEVLEENK